ncbi:PaaI family thioesterase [Luteipulveratus sp. YIM 133132]|uniref:PaaI family thioesterase n=1 Tax=Luteipulveratus flavus TaxID=3031728 RepID=A0ABT6C7P7_9MICO|nr:MULTISPECIES: PaaI family thioesterase [unclassified Luteipulveratus]MDE9365997.1 PaaI family thioesterase [Luteipulveratus sp. YIM 133132]MDF8264099.1 PaaI family thioesterase [Luteipulveratus sp. YIM 133296]
MTEAPTPAPEPAEQSEAELTALFESMNAGTLGERMGIEFLEVSPGRVVARMPVEGNTQPYGLLHGGASVVLAETVGSIAAALHAGRDRIAVGLDISSTHHRGVRSGHVTATTTPLSQGRSVATYDVAIVDDEGNRVNTSRITCMLRDAPPRAR